ncbi:MAG: STAS domain-containing protein [Gammaproteobacteria bacterium]
MSVRDCPQGSILVLAGELNAVTSRDLFQVVIQQAPKTPRHIFFDFSQLRSITAAGLRTLYKIFQMTRSDCKLIFCATRNTAADLSLTKVGFPNIVTFHESLASAQSEIEVQDQVHKDSEMK